MLPRREREGDRSPEADAAAESAVVRPQPATPAPPAPAPPAPAPPDRPVAADDDHFDERRWREAGGPEDRALYTCACGYVWDTAVSASVTCPHCGTAQAW